jgi:hypothetical protein
MSLRKFATVVQAGVGLTACSASNLLSCFIGHVAKAIPMGLDAPAAGKLEINPMGAGKSRYNNVVPAFPHGGGLEFPAPMPDDLSRREPFLSGFSRSALRVPQKACRRRVLRHFA